MKKNKLKLNRRTEHIQSDVLKKRAASLDKSKRPVRAWTLATRLQHRRVGSKKK